MVPGTSGFVATGGCKFATDLRYQSTQHLSFSFLNIRVIWIKGRNSGYSSLSYEAQAIIGGLLAEVGAKDLCVTTPTFLMFFNSTTPSGTAIKHRSGNAHLFINF
jgi:hypothetical protein